MSNNIKIVLFDADGVVLSKRDKYFSQRLREDFGIEIDPANEASFFKNEYHLCEIGKSDLRKEVAKRFPDWGWTKSVDELLNYWFSYENQIDQEVLNIVGQLKSNSIQCYLASDHSKYRADNLMHEVGLTKHFDGAFFSAYLGYTKAEPEFFKKILGQLKVNPESIMFWDDKPNNIEVAKTSGIKAFLFEGVDKIRQVLQDNQLI